jgi:Zn-dependent protease
VSEHRRSFALGLGTWFGIPVRVHVSLVLLFLWVAFDAKRDQIEPLTEVTVVGLLLFCVLLHEFGHALMARVFKIQTSDIVLYPFGGIASIQGSPSPFAELLIAAAGPLVNVIIALALLLVSEMPQEPEAIIESNSLSARLLVANIFLVIFNLIPALPMDGGRILRAFLALLGLQSATAISCRLSQALSLCMGFYALYSASPILVIIAVLIFTQATSELMHDKAQRLSQGLTVRQAMIEAKHLVSFPHGATLEAAFQIAAKSPQPVFPVFHGSSCIGLIDRQTLIEAGASNPSDEYLSAYIQREVPQVQVEAPLTALIHTHILNSHEYIIVLEHQQFAGLLIRERVLEFLLLNGMRVEQKTFAEKFGEDLP